MQISKEHSGAIREVTPVHPIVRTDNPVELAEWKKLLQLQECSLYGSNGKIIPVTTTFCIIV